MGTNRLTWEQKAKMVQELEGGTQSVSAVSQKWRVSRECAYKWWRRYREEGMEGLRERSRKPLREPRRMAAKWSERIAAMRKRHAKWGGRKLRVLLKGEHPRARVPAASTIGAELRRLGYTSGKPRKAHGPEVMWAPSFCARRANDIWTIDFKGWFRTGDGTRCSPLTVRDLHSRFGLCARVLRSTETEPVKEQLQKLFQRRGLPKVMRADQGPPFAGGSPGLLSRLSAWWVSLGIKVEFSRRARPGDNASHEQWHRELKAQTAKPPAATPQAQQRRLDRWVREYNCERPHEAHQQRVPAQFYTKSSRRYAGAREASYPKKWPQRMVHMNGEINWEGKRRFISESFGGCRVGMKPLGPGVWRVYFYEHVIGDLHASDFGGLRSARYRRPRD